MRVETKAALIRWGSVLALAGLAAVLFFGLRVPQGFSALREKHQQIRQLQEGNAELRLEIEKKRERIEQLQKSRAEQELEIRKSRKLLHKDETTIITPDQEKKEGVGR